MLVDTVHGSVDLLTQVAMVHAGRTGRTAYQHPLMRGLIALVAHLTVVAALEAMEGCKWVEG